MPKKLTSAEIVRFATAYNKHGTIRAAAARCGITAGKASHKRYKRALAAGLIKHPGRAGPELKAELKPEPAQKFELDPNLWQFATERQCQLLSAWAKHGTTRAAAAAIGISQSRFPKAKSALLVRAALRGYTPETPNFHTGRPIPPGFVLRGQSAMVDEHGALLKRWDKTRQEGMALSEAHQLPDPKKVTKLSTMLDAEGRVIVQWIAEKPEDVARERAWREFARELATDIPRIEPVESPPTINSSLLAGYPVGDHHLGMLVWPPESTDAYDLGIGERLLRDAFDHLATTTCSAEHAIVAFLGDFMHYDSFETVTPTSRNILDSDTRFPKLVKAAVRTMRYAVDAALKAHRQIHVIIEPGNHDLASSVFLAECLLIAYENEPRVTVDTSPQHFHYYRFGKVLLGTHHGHGTKMANLPLIMATDRAEDWGATRYRYMWTGHVHTSKVQPAVSAQDYSGCVVESFRVLPPADAWAQQKGYRAMRDMKAVVFHKEFGEVARHTVNPRMLEESYNT